MSPSARSLATFEIPVARGGATLARLQDIGIHGETHAAPGLPPLEPGLAEDSVEPFRLRLLLDEP